MPHRHLSQLGIPIKGRGTRAGENHPQPQLRRPFLSLDGTWDFAIDPDGTATHPTFDRTIEVPFAPETRRSGIHDTSHFRACWYRRRIDRVVRERSDRILLHFGAVDWRATVWANGQRVAVHSGGYTPFAVDVTDAIGADGRLEILVRAQDDPDDLQKPRGKQDWQAEPHSIWYPRTTGIWQSVWLERVPASRIDALRWTPSLDRWEIALDAFVTGDNDLRLRVRLQCADLLIADDLYRVVAGEVHRRIALSDPGIDDFRNELLWSPDRPRIVEAELELIDDSNEVIDRVESYTALRSFDIEGDRFVLNGRPILLRLVLDQGYWPETGMTPPDLEAIRRDIELVRAMGFNGVRKHQKLEDPRWLHLADRLGLLVWEEMPSAYRFTTTSIERLVREWTEAIRRDASHPCIITWVPINESWGVPSLPNSEAQKNWVRALYHLTKTLDPTRPVVGNDGWEAVTTDVIGIHDYDDDIDRMTRRYRAEELLPRLVERERPGGRAIAIEPTGTHPIVLSEVGGIALGGGDESWGYSRARNAADYGARLKELFAALRSMELLAGYCYTQFADTYQETNGLLRADRTPKIPLEEIRKAVRG